MPLVIPSNLALPIEAHQKWLRVVREAKALIQNDADLQVKASKGFRLKGRPLAPNVVGSTYAQYCGLANRMYLAYLDNVQLQRAPYMEEIVSVVMRRLFELRQELVQLIVNHYVYLDSALVQLRFTPKDVEIIVPCCIPMEARRDSVEELLQTMWLESAQRTAPPKVDASTNAYMQRSSETIPAPKESEPIIVPEEYIQATIIQSHERYRQHFMKDFKAKCNWRRTYFVQNKEPAPEWMKILAARIIQQVYRKFMEIKRQRVVNHNRNLLLGMVPDPWRSGRLDPKEETKKLYMLRRRVNERTRQTYLEELEKQKARLIIFNKDAQIEDISEGVREWFKEWYYGYGFFPEYPYEVEGGTIMVVRGTYPTVEEKLEADAKLEAAMKGKTKEMLKAEKKQAQLEASMRAQTEKENQKMLDEQEFKMKCNPFGDPGYKVQQSKHMESLVEVFQKYNGCWSIYDSMSPEYYGEIVHGFIEPLLQEDLMCQLHQEWRRHVDELMRLELKLLTKAQMMKFAAEGKKFPVRKPRPMPSVRRTDTKKRESIDGKLVASFEYLFDLGIFSKPTAKIDDIMGDSNYAAYDCNIADPDSSFPPPGYGDVRTRLVMSCVFGAGVEPGAPRRRAVLLLGPARHGKAFLADCVAGELNAVKIDISPEVFSSVLERPAKAVGDVFRAAKVFQPTVVFMRDVERVFFKKVPMEQRYLKAKRVKAALTKCVKGIAADDRLIFIATCTTPFGFPAKEMASLFDEIILVPRADYNSVQMFFYNKLQSIRSIERDYCVQSVAQLLQGYGFGAIMDMYDRVMTPERIIRLNVTPLQPLEFIDAMEGEDQVSLEDYKLYQDFVVQNSSLKKPRAELEEINIRRADAYRMMEKKKKDEKKDD